MRERTTEKSLVFCSRTKLFSEDQNEQTHKRQVPRKGFPQIVNSKQKHCRWIFSASEMRGRGAQCDDDDYFFLSFDGVTFLSFRWKFVSSFEKWKFYNWVQLLLNRTKKFKEKNGKFYKNFLFTHRHNWKIIVIVSKIYYYRFNSAWLSTWFSLTSSGVAHWLSKRLRIYVRVRFSKLNQSNILLTKR